MTYILTCATDTAVFQLSDRRLTSLDPPYGLHEDTNKLILVDSSIAVSYTGLAQIGGRKADDWIARTLAPHKLGSIEAYLEQFRVEATRAFSAIALPRQKKRHAFRFVGWGHGPIGERPFAATIFNAIDPHTGRWLPTAKDEFTTALQVFEPLGQRCVLSEIGNGLPDKLIEVNFRDIRTAVRADPAGLVRIFEELVNAARRVAAYHGDHGRVGNDFNTVTIPLRALEVVRATGKTFIPYRPPVHDCITTLFVGATGEELEHPEPIWVFHGNIMEGSVTFHRWRIFRSGQLGVREYLAADDTWTSDIGRARRFMQETDAIAVIRERHLLADCEMFPSV